MMSISHYSLEILDGCRFEASRSSHVFVSSFLNLFKHTLCKKFKQAVGPGVLQYLCHKDLINMLKNI